MNNLSAKCISPSIDLSIFSLHIAEILSIIRYTINFISTILNIYHNNDYYLLALIWSILVKAILLLTSLLILAGSIIILLSDPNLNVTFFDASRGEDPILYQHLFRSFRPFEVYVFIIPGFGLISHIIAKKKGKKETFGSIGITYNII